MRGANAARDARVRDGPAPQYRLLTYATPAVANLRLPFLTSWKTSFFARFAG